MKKYSRNFMTSIAVFSIFATSALAATGTADKAANKSGSVESVSIQGNGTTSWHYTNLYEGTGSGTGELYEFKRFLPDKKISSSSVSNKSGSPNASVSFVADANSAYNVVAKGDYAAGIRTSVVIN